MHLISANINMPIPFSWFTLSAKTVKFCAYSFQQINFFCMAHLDHRGLRKVCILKTEGKKGEKNKKNN